MSPLTKPRANSLISAFRKGKLLVVGDVVLDRFIWGKVDRISPEAPIPVVEVTGRSTVLGGAANVALNIVALGGKTTLIGVIGKDSAGKEVRDALTSAGLKADALPTSSNRPTTVKTRVVAHSQQVVRFDEESTNHLSAATEKKVIAQIEKSAVLADAVAVSDYGKGVITESVMDALRIITKKRDIPLLVDPKPPSRAIYKGASLLKPNIPEASFYAGTKLKTDVEIAEWARNFMNELDIGALLITRGGEGLSLIERGKKPFTQPALAHEVYDVTGAGDTVLATMTLAIVAGANLRESVALANRAAGITVGKVGVATVSPEELRG